MSEIGDSIRAQADIVESEANLAARPLTYYRLTDVVKALHELAEQADRLPARRQRKVVSDG